MKQVEIRIKKYTTEVQLTGRPGMAGPEGQDGQNGQPGKSAYEVWLDAGNTGTVDDYLDSLKGEQGETGPAGTTDYTQLTNKPNLDVYVLKVAGKDLSTNDFTNTLKTKLDGLSNYSLPISSSTVLGGVKIGSGISISGDGTISVSASGSGDMLKSTYDINNNGIVDDSQALGGQNPSYYLDRDNHTGTQLANTISDFASAFNTNFSNKNLDDLNDVIITSISDGQSIKYDAASEKFINYTPSGGGGLVNFTDTLNNTGINSTRPISILTAFNAASVVDMALQPKFGGALTRDVADGTPTGGNKRASNSVDWQGSRTTADQVALGDTSTISGGSDNKIDSSGSYAGIGAGFNNYVNGFITYTCSGYNSINNGGGYGFMGATHTSKIQFGDCSFSAIIAGYLGTISQNSNNSFMGCSFNNTITNYSQFSAIVTGKNISMDGSQLAFCGTGDTHIILNANFSFMGAGRNNENRANFTANLGGQYNKITGQYGVILGGQYNTVDAIGGYALGKYAHTNGFIGSKVFSNGNITSTPDGSMQVRENVLFTRTNSGTSAVLTSDGNAPDATNQLVIRDGETKIVTGIVLIQNIATKADKSRYNVDVTVSRTGSTITIEDDSTFNPLISAGALTAGQSLLIDVDTTNFALRFTIQKNIGTDIKGIFTMNSLESL